MIQSLYVANNAVRRNDHQEYAWEPGAEGDEEAPVSSECPVRPIVERAFVREHVTKLGGTDSTGNKKSEAADNPESKSACARLNSRGCVGNEKDNQDVCRC